MKIFKNFKTKRQLKEEIAELKGMLHLQKPQTHMIEREVQKVSSDMVFDNNVPVECIKEQIAHGMVEFLKPLIEWDIENEKTNPFKKRMRGNIYIWQRKNSDRTKVSSSKKER